MLRMLQKRGVVVGFVCHNEVQPGDWQAKLTHVVMPELMRNSKLLAGLAAGAWIVGTSYLIGMPRAERHGAPRSVTARSLTLFCRSLCRKRYSFGQ